jgi:hypothetical protein
MCEYCECFNCKTQIKHIDNDDDLELSIIWGGYAFCSKKCIEEICENIKKIEGDEDNY